MRAAIYLLFLLWGLPGLAQNITVVEYYIDADPGYGNGTSVTITPAASIDNLSFSIDISSQADGFHVVHVRAKDASNNWSTTFSRPFYKISASAFGNIPDIEYVEYFVDDDPGNGAATSVPITPGVEIIDLSFAIPLNSYADGFHTLTLRARDANNNWSTAFSRPFYKIDDSVLATIPDITKLEYFIDNDPGHGVATSVLITPDVQIIDLNFAIPLNSYTDGFHTLTLRARDANNNWSTAFSRPFYKIDASVLATIPDITKLEYFIDDDPGVSAGENVTITEGISISNFLISIPMNGLTDGDHTLSFRAQDGDGDWSVVYTADFIVAPPPTITSIVDSSAGIGASVIINGTNFSTVIEENIVTFNGITATFNNATVTRLDVIVPVGATTGPISVSVNNQSITSVTDFTVLSSATEITTFSFAEQISPITPDNINHTITIEVATFTDVSNLTPTIAVSSGATINPASGVAQDFSSVVTYVVTAQDGTTTQNWTVTVIEAPNILTYSTSPDLSTAIFSGTAFSVATQTTEPRGLVFNNDGTKLYVVSAGGTSVSEYSLSVPFEINAPVIITSFSITAPQNLGSARGIAFNNDGTKMYLASDFASDIYEYLLGTAFDVSSAVFNFSLSVSLQVGTASDVVFNNDGFKMFVLDLISDRVNEYSLSSAFDISTASFSISFSVTTEELNPDGLAFNPNGTKMYVLGFLTNTVYEYELSTAFDVSTTSFSKSFSVVSEESVSVGLTFNNIGTNMFIVGSDGNKIYQYDLGNNAFVESSANDGSVEGSLIVSISNDTFVNAGGVLTSPSHFTIDNLPLGFTSSMAVGTDGLTSTLSFEGNAVANQDDDDVSDLQFTFTSSAFTASDVSDFSNADGPASSGFGIDFSDNAVLSYATSINLSSATFSGSTYQIANATGITFNNDGTKMYLLNGGSSDIFELDLGTPFDVSSASINASFSVAGLSTGPHGLAFNKKGTKMYMVDGNGKNLYQFALSTEFDITSASVSDNISLAAQTDVPSGIAFDNTGYQLFVIAWSSAEVLSYDLSTPYEIGTASFAKSFSVGTQEGNATGLRFNSDGTKMFITGQQNDAVIGYTLSTPFDIGSSVVLEDSYSVAAMETVPTDVTFNTNGTKMYVVGTANGEVLEYNLTSNAFEEVGENDGAVEGSIIISITGDTFDNTSGTFTSPTHFSLTNLPSGLSPTIVPSTDGLTATLTLSGNSTAHESENDVSDLQFSFTDMAFTSSVASAVINGTGPASSNLGIDFDSESPSMETEIIQFSFVNQLGPAVIDGANDRIDIEVLFSADVSNLTAEFEISTGAIATISGIVQVSGTMVNDFSTSPVAYLITAEDNLTTQTWDVYVSQSTSLNAETDFTSFEFLGISTASTIDDVGHTISVSVPSGTDLSVMIAVFEPSTGASTTVSGVVQVSGTTPNDFTNSVTYVVTAEDVTTKQNWVVSVAIEEEDLTNPEISASTLPTLFEASSGGSDASITVTDNVGIDEVIFYSKTTSASDFSSQVVTSSSDTYLVTLTENQISNTGLLYYFFAIDANQNDVSTDTVQIVIQYTNSTSPPIPSLSSGGRAQDWRMFSIPFDLENEAISAIIEPVLGPYDDSKWRLFHYKNDNEGFIEYTKGLTSIERGKGYWFNSVEKATVRVGAGIAPANTVQNLAVITLISGWNQIGNPYAFTISWSDVLSHNGVTNEVENNLRVFTGGTSLSNATILNAYAGAYLKANKAITLEIPLKSTTGGRLSKQNEFDEGWLLNLQLEAGIFSNTVSGVGMHPEAVSGNDRFDQIRAPRFVSFIDATFDHPEYFMPNFSRDIVTVQENYIWEFSVTSNIENEIRSISWAKYDLDGNKKLILFDNTNGNMVDMATTNYYSYASDNVRNFKIIFGDDDFLLNQFENTNVFLGANYPNPFNLSTVIPYTIYGTEDDFKVKINIYSVSGKLIKTLVNETKSSGIYSVDWDGNGPSGNHLSGMFIYSLEVETDQGVQSVRMKMIVE